MSHVGYRNRLFWGGDTARCEGYQRRTRCIIGEDWLGELSCLVMAPFRYAVGGSIPYVVCFTLDCGSDFIVRPSSLLKKQVFGCAPQYVHDSRCSCPIVSSYVTLAPSSENVLSTPRLLKPPGNLRVHLQNGCLSDPDRHDLSLYFVAGHTREGFVKIRSARGTSRVESYHTPLRSLMASFQPSSRLAHATMMLHKYRRNHRMSAMCTSLEGCVDCLAYAARLCFFLPLPAMPIFIMFSILAVLIALLWLRKTSWYDEENTWLLPPI